MTPMTRILKCNDTLVTATHLVLNGDLNEHGTVYGGQILDLVDGDASVSAMKVTPEVIVTAAMDHVQFLRPFKLRDAMTMESYVTGVGHRSIEVFCKMLAEHLESRQREVAFTAFFTYVIADPKSAVAYDVVEGQTAEQKALVAGYEKRRAARKQLRQSELTVNQALTTKLPWEEK